MVDGAGCTVIPTAVGRLELGMRGGHVGRFGEPDHLGSLDRKPPGVGNVIRDGPKKEIFAQISDSQAVQLMALANQCERRPRP